MLVDQLFSIVITRPNLHKHPMDRDIYFDFMELCVSLTTCDDRWTMRRAIHLGILDCILSLIRESRYGKWITQNGLKGLINILNHFEDDIEEKDMAMAQLASTSVSGESGLEILEQLFQEDNEEIVDLVIEILDGHYGYDEEFFCDEDGYPREDRARCNFFEDDTVYGQAEKYAKMYDGGCTVEELKEEEPE